jgi:hypothetical protein
MSGAQLFGLWRGIVAAVPRAGSQHLTATQRGYPALRVAISRNGAKLERRPDPLRLLWLLWEPELLDEQTDLVLCPWIEWKLRVLVVLHPRQVRRNLGPACPEEQQFRATSPAPEPPDLDPHVLSGAGGGFLWRPCEATEIVGRQERDRAVDGASARTSGEWALLV